MTASRKFLQSINLVNLDTDPTEATQGDMYYNTTNDEIRYFDGSSWIALGTGTGGGITEPVPKLDFDTGTISGSSVGRLVWNDGEGTMDLGLKGGNVVLQIGQEQVVRCYNGTGSTINEGSVVYITGAQGQRPTIALARADSESTSAYVFGVATENIAHEAEGFVTTFGIVNNLNTLGLTEGAAIWLSSTTAGAFTETKPSAPNHLVQIGFVLRSHSTSGRIFVRNQNGYEIEELHDVGVTSRTDNDILSFDSTLGYWKNQNLATAITEVDGAGSNIDADKLDGNQGSYYAPIASPAFSGTPTANTAAVDTNTTQLATTAFVIGQGYLKSTTAATTYQPLDGDLTTIAGLTGTGWLHRTGTNSWQFDNPSDYLTTASAASTYLTISNASSTYLTQANASSNYQPLDGDLTAIAALTGNGVLNRTGTNTWELIVPQDYLTVSDAATTYLTIANAASTYLTSATAASTYLTSATAATTYAPLASPAFTGTPTTTYQRIIPTGTKPTYTEGNLFYHNEEKTVIIQGSQGFEIPVGQREWARVRNGTASTITKGSVVYAVGVHIAGDPIHGHHISIDLADASDINKIDVLGIVAEDIAAGDHGYVVVRGHIENMNTSGLTAGTRIHLSATTPGGLVDNAPTYPNYPVDLGRCLTSSATVGGIYVDIQPHTIEGLRVTGDGYVDGNFTVGGDLSILGSSSSISTSNLAVANNFIYLNSGDTIGAAGTTFTGSGLDDATLVGHYTGTTTKTFKVKIVSTGPDKFRWSTDNFATDNGSDITITAATPQALSDNISVEFVAGTGHTVNDIWSGTAAPLNVDLALIGNRNTGTTGVGYTHTGLFFDVSDAKFKVFDEYDPEPVVNIDTTDVSFSLATLVAETFEGSLIGNVTGNVNGNITGNAATVTNGVYTTGSYSNPSWITGLAWSKISSTPTTLSGYGITDAQPLDADLSAIAALSGTSGLLKKTAANTWTLDTSTYLTSSTGVTSVNGSTGAVTGLAELAGATFTGLITSSKAAPAVNLTGAPSATASTNALLNVGSSSWSDTNIIASFTHTVDSYSQVVIQNKSSGTTASADLVISNDTGSAAANYVDLGMNSSLFGGTGPWDSPNGGYLYVNGGSLAVGTQGANALTFVTGDTIRATLDANGTFTIPTSASGTVNALTLSGTPSSTIVARGLLQVGATVGYSDRNMVASFVGDINDYSQVVVQNKNAGNAASADFIVNNNSSTANNIYGDFGINSSAYTGTGPFDTASAVYLYSIGSNLSVGTRSANDIILATNNTTRLQIADATSTFSNATVVDVPNTASVSSFTVDSASWLSSTTGSNSTQYGLLRVGDPVVANVNLLASFAKNNINSYVSVVFQNSNPGNAASVDLVFQNNLTDTSANSVYGDIGLSSSGYVGTGFSAANQMYMYMNNGNLAVGTMSDNSFRVVTGTGQVERLSISGTGVSTFTGRVVTPALTPAAAGFNITPTTQTPTTLSNGDMWVTTAGLFYRANGATIGPLTTAGTLPSQTNNQGSYLTTNGSATSWSKAGITFDSAGAYGTQGTPTNASNANAVWTGFSYLYQTAGKPASNTTLDGIPVFHIPGNPRGLDGTFSGAAQYSAAGKLTIGPVLNTTDSDIIALFSASVNSYAQVALSNDWVWPGSGNVSASTDIVFYNDQNAVNGANAGYGDIGINNSRYTSVGTPFDDPNGMYVYMNGGSLSLGTQPGGVALPAGASLDLYISTNNTERLRFSGSAATATFAAGMTVTIPTLVVSGSATIAGYVQSNTTALDNVLPFSKAGVYATFTGATKCRIPSNCTIVGISAMSGSVSSAVTVQVNRNGTSIGTVSLGTGTNVVSTETSLSTAITAGDYLSVDVTAGGGSDLVVSIRYRPS